MKLDENLQPSTKVPTKYQFDMLGGGGYSQVPCFSHDLLSPQGFRQSKIAIIGVKCELP